MCVAEIVEINLKSFLISLLEKKGLKSQ